jgi:hypothetical protein
MGSPKKNWTPLPEPLKKKETSDNTENLLHKAEIDRMKKLLTEKIKDPKLARKAAMIISEMLNPKP